MKSNYITNSTEQRRVLTEIARAEIAKQEAEECPKCQLNIGYQTIATVLWLLHRDFGWGTTRLNRLKNDLEAEFKIMAEGIPGLAKTDYSGNDLIRGLKEIGVDIEKSQFTT